MSDKLSRDEILTLEAGREMDAVVAKHIMELIWWKRGGGMWIALPEDATDIPDYWIQDVPPRKLTKYDVSELVPHFSTDIAAAWQVVSKMLASNYDISLANWRDDDNKGEWGVDFYTMIDEAAFNECASANGPTVELAICRAALLATLEDA